MHPRFIPTVEQFRPYRHHPAPFDPSQAVSRRELMDWSARRRRQPASDPRPAPSAGRIPG